MFLIFRFYSSRASNEHRGSGSEAESDEENEEGDYTVYECPGLAAVSISLFLSIFLQNTILKILKDFLLLYST